MSNQKVSLPLMPQFQISMAGQQQKAGFIGEQQNQNMLQIQN